MPVKHFRGGFLKAQWPKCFYFHFFAREPSIIKPIIVFGQTKEYLLRGSKTHASLLNDVKWVHLEKRDLCMLFFIYVVGMHLQIQNTLFSNERTETILIMLIVCLVLQPYLHNCNFMLLFSELPFQSTVHKEQSCTNLWQVFAKSSNKVKVTFRPLYTCFCFSVKRFKQIHMAKHLYILLI